MLSKLAGVDFFGLCASNILLLAGVFLFIILSFISCVAFVGVCWNIKCSMISSGCSFGLFIILIHVVWPIGHPFLVISYSILVFSY